MCIHCTGQLTQRQGHALLQKQVGLILSSVETCSTGIFLYRGKQHKALQRHFSPASLAQKNRCQQVNLCTNAFSPEVHLSLSPLFGVCLSFYKKESLQRFIHQSWTKEASTLHQVWGQFRTAVTVKTGKKCGIVSVSLRPPPPEYPVCSDWSAHTRLRQHRKQQSSCVKLILQRAN